jgi:rod shape-determining protein MreC
MRGTYHRPDHSVGVAIGLVVLSFLLMTFDIRSSQAGVAATLRNGAQTVAAPVQTGVNAIVDPIVDFGDGLANLAGLREENARLRSDLEESQLDAARVPNLENQIAQLRALLDLDLSNDLALISAEVTARGGALEQSFTIDQGASNGVLAGHPVIDDKGALVGVVSEVTDTTAIVIPIIARDAPGITVRLDNGQRGSVRGQGTTLVLEVFEASEPVEEGQLLQTFGSDRFPKDLDVGIVVASALPTGQVIRVEVAPIVDIDRLRFVAVVPWPSEEPVPEEPVVPVESTDTTIDPAAESGDGEEGGDPAEDTQP